MGAFTLEGTVVQLRAAGVLSKPSLSSSYTMVHRVEMGWQGVKGVTTRQDDVISSTLGESVEEAKTIPSAGSRRILTPLDKPDIPVQWLLLAPLGRTLILFCTFCIETYGSHTMEQMAVVIVYTTEGPPLRSPGFFLGVSMWSGTPPRYLLPRFAPIHSSNQLLFGRTSLMFMSARVS